ncbi:MAG: acyl-CoA dehydrogenase family protein [Sphingobium phenoxybenzoativorans]|uniref:Acyl-CoA/acyl-ACP dehydrogenase n=1 Tax=Sphingobium phenoxybenzoativorans TaxID=1592790 RepID=A0A975K911_9SPHN|nr:acyl-CoA dehydrogenase family protein [Sphingobium phenoxybenzoativorans]QUT06707.1 acyl-CoA/acyl-ACP dehydrogenase [Sphingobium phenoxybenzoativorans]
MDLMPSPEEEQIIDMARGLLSKELPVDYLRWEEGPAKAADRALLPQCAELGWIALGLSEEHGGFGFGATEEMLLFREVGRALVTPVLFASVIAARLAATLGESDLTAAIATGNATVSLAVPDAGGSGYFLIDAEGSDRILLVDHDSVTLLDPSAFSNRSAIRSLDPTVTLESAVLDSGAAGLQVGGRDAEPLFRHISLLIAAMLVGAAEAVRDLSVAHASERTQFGQKIGTFQAVSHPCADMAVRCEAALSQAKLAAVVVRDAGDDAEFQVTAARIVALDAALSNAAAAIQLHGGMGFAAEYPVHFYLKRAHLLDQVGGRIALQLDDLFALNA